MLIACRLNWLIGLSDHLTFHYVQTKIILVVDDVSSLRTITVVFTKYSTLTRFQSDVSFSSFVPSSLATHNLGDHLIFVRVIRPLNHRSFSGSILANLRFFRYSPNRLSPSEESRNMVCLLLQPFDILSLESKDRSGMWMNAKQLRGRLQSRYLTSRGLCCTALICNSAWRITPPLKNLGSPAILLSVGQMSP